MCNIKYNETKQLVVVGLFICFWVCLVYLRFGIWVMFVCVGDDDDDDDGRRGSIDPVALLIPQMQCNPPREYLPSLFDFASI